MEWLVSNKNFELFSLPKPMFAYCGKVDQELQLPKFNFTLSNLPQILIQDQKFHCLVVNVI